MPDPKLDRHRRKIKRARRAERRQNKKAGRLRKKVAYLQGLIAKTIARRRDLAKVAILDGTPVTLEQKIALLWARQNGWNGVVNSGDRRSVIGRILRRLGKQSQAELYEGWIRRLPGFFPANPPTQGSHLRLGDGVLGAVGVPLPAFMQGLDTSDATNLRSILSGGGFTAQRTYSNEEWHTNFTAPIKPVLIAKGLV